MRKNSLLLLTMVLTVFLAGSVWGQMALQVDDATWFLGTTGNVLTVSLENDQNVAALQFTINFDPDCFTFNSQDFGPTAEIKTGRSEALNIFSASNPSPGVVKLAGTGIGTVIAAGSGPVAQFHVDVAADCAEGPYVFEISETKVADPSGTPFDHEAISGTITVLAAACIPGVSETSFDMGDVRVGMTGTDVLTVTNDGTADGSVTITVDGCATVDITSFDLNMGASQDVVVGCAPTAEGPCAGTVTVACDQNEVVVDVACVGVCSYISTNCPIDFGEVTIVEPEDQTLTITNAAEATADLNVTGITFDDADFSAGPLPGPIAPGASADVIITAAPAAVEGAVTATATIESDACGDPVACELTIVKVAPPYVVLGLDPLYTELKPLQADTIQVTIDQVTDVLPIYALYFRIVVDTMFFFDSTNVWFEPGKTVIDSAGWDMKIHAYPPEWGILPGGGFGPGVADTALHKGLDVWLIGGIPLTTNGCLVNFLLVPNTDHITALGCDCGGPDCWTTVKFLDAMANEGEPEIVFDATVTLSINDGPVWDTFDQYVGYPPMDASGIANGTMNSSTVTVTAHEGFQYGCLPLAYHINASDDEGDMKMLVAWIPSAMSAGTGAILYRIDTGGNINLNVIGVNDTTGLGWWYYTEIDPKITYVGDHTDSYIVQTTHTTPAGKGGPQPCIDQLDVVATVLPTYYDAHWIDIVSHACGAPEPIVELCTNRDYYATFPLAEAGLLGPIYSIDMILDYDCECLVPYEVGNEGLPTENIGALTYSIDEENCQIAVSTALNFSLATVADGNCASIVYVGFELQPESVSPACTTDHEAILSIDHVKINEEAPHYVCWENGTITYTDYSLGGDIYYSDTGIPVPGVTVEFSDLVTEEVVGTTVTDVAGAYGSGDWEYCPPGYCITPTMTGFPGYVITAQDASMILRSICNQITLSHNDSIAADVTCSGTGFFSYDITAYDAAVLLRYVVGYPVTSCIGTWVFEYVPGDAPLQKYAPEVCFPKLTASHLNEDFEAVIVGDVTQNFGSPKVVATTPDVAFRGREAKIVMSGDVYSATLELVGVMARDVIVEGMEYEWRSADNVTKIAIATAEPVTNAAVTVVLESGQSLELFGYVNGTSFATRTEKVPVIPTEFTLAQNYPNPFNPVTSIDFGLPENSEVTITVYNVLGQVVTDLVNGEMDAGYHKVVWDASNMASGVYFYRIAAGDFTTTKRMVLMK